MSSADIGANFGTGRTADGEMAPRYRRDIDGLRSIAVGSVVLFHAGVGWMPSGFAGVDIFFVISGFLIGGIIFRAVAAGNFSFATFYARRARRILPALFFVILLTLIAGLVLLSAQELKKLSASSLAALGAVSNIHFWRKLNYFSPFADLDPLLMTWSLGVEEQFYFLFPFLLIALGQSGARRALGVVLGVSLASLALSLWLTAHFPTAAFYLLPARAWELGVGVALAVWAAGGGKGGGGRMLTGRLADIGGIVGLAMLIGSITLFSTQTSWPGAAAMLPVSGTLLLLASEEGIVNRRLLSARVPVGIGLISYSWYLWHWPIMVYLRLSTVQEPSPRAMGIAVLLSLVGAVLSWRFVEQPLRRAVLPSGQVLKRYGVALLVVAAVPLALIITKGVPQRLSTQPAVVDFVVRETHKYPCLNGGGAEIVSAPVCASRKPGLPAIVVLGDSHAAAMGPAIADFAQRNGIGYSVMTKASCRPLLGVTVQRNDLPSFARDCAAYMNDAYARLAADPDVKAVMIVGMWTGPIAAGPTENYERADGKPAQSELALMEEGLAAAIRRLTGAGKHVFVLEDTPFWSYDIAKAARIAAIGPRLALQHAAEPGVDADAGAGRITLPPALADARVAIVTRAAGGSYLPSRQDFCRAGADRCIWRDGSRLLFADNSHLTPDGANFALRSHETALRAAMGR